MSSRKEIRESVLNTTRQNNAQIGSIVNEFINLTLHEINDPSWAFTRRDYNHLWSFLRRKTTFSTTASTSDYVLGRDVDRIGLLRQTTTPTKLTQIPDDLFFEEIPNPTDTGNPRMYRLWEMDGVSTRLAAADTIDVVSSSTSDSGNSTLTVSVMGYDSNGIWQTETYQLNGTTTVAGTKTFAAREIYVSKQTDTTGNITVTENSGSTTLVVLGPNERSARFRVLSLYPIPSSSITMSMEYYTYIPELENDSDTPLFHEKWHYVVRLGTLAKVYQYLTKEQEFLSTTAFYRAAVKSMVAGDKANPDLINYLKKRSVVRPSIRLQKSEDTITA